MNKKFSWILNCVILAVIFDDFVFQTKIIAERL